LYCDGEPERESAMTGHNSDVHAREVELARHLTENGLHWNIQTGDWFCAPDNKRHCVLDIVRLPNGDIEVVGMNGNRYAKSEVVWLPHITDCGQWFNSNDWEYDIDRLSEESWTIHLQRRRTEYRLEKTEPTDLAAAYAGLLEILTLVHFGWA
jgi:hypothetical protein